MEYIDLTQVEVLTATVVFFYNIGFISYNRFNRFQRN